MTRCVSRVVPANFGPSHGYSLWRTAQGLAGIPHTMGSVPMSVKHFARYFRNSSWLVVPRIGNATVGLVVGIIVARHLGPQDLGTLSYISSLVALFTAVASLGLDAIVVRELVKYPAVGNRLLGTAFGLRLLASLVIAAGLWAAFCELSDSTTAKALLGFAVISLIAQSTNIVQSHFHAVVRGRSIAYSQLARIVVTVISSVILVWAGAGVLWFGALGLVAALIEAAVLLQLYRRGGHHPSAWRFDTALGRRLLSDSWPLILSGIAVSLYMKVDQVIIAALMDEHAVGLYAVAVRLAEGWSFVPVAIIASVFPAVVRMGQSGDPKYWRRVQQLYDLMVILGVSVAVPVTVFSDTIVHLLYGDAYAGAGDVLAISTWSALFIALGAANMRVLLSEGRTKQSFVRTGTGAALNIALNYLLIPPFGLTGAAVATVAAYALAAYLSIPWFPGQRRHFALASSSLLVIPAILRFAQTGVSLLRQYRHRPRQLPSR